MGLWDDIVRRGTTGEVRKEDKEKPFFRDFDWTEEMDAYRWDKNQPTIVDYSGIIKVDYHNGYSKAYMDKVEEIVSSILDIMKH